MTMYCRDWQLFEDDDALEGLLVLLNTQGGDGGWLSLR